MIKNPNKTEIDDFDLAIIDENGNELIKNNRTKQNLELIKFKARASEKVQSKH
ncbi:hypothetical protein [Mycoplasma sp. 005V]|uniref:hypothetical protein n=1 Tax=unclassified Mycoplasma TaxID=2683645 RepID=UPI003A8C0C10